MQNKVFWLGGSSCSGKSTIAKRLAEKYALKLYNTDQYAFGKFMFELEHEDQYPAILYYKNLLLAGMDSFAHRDVDESFTAFKNYCQQVFPLLLKDLHKLAETNRVIVEGAHIFPQLIHPHTKNTQCFFLISDKNQQRKIWLKEMNQEIPGGHPGEIESFHNSKNKEAIIKTRVDFHDRIGRYISAGAGELGFPVLQVTENIAIDFAQHEIEKCFGLN